MKVYTLRFAHPDGADDALQFKAPDLPEALVAAHRHAATRDAELWDGETRLCAIRRSKKRSAFSFGEAETFVAA